MFFFFYICMYVPSHYPRIEINCVKMSCVQAKTTSTCSNNKLWFAEGFPIQFNRGCIIRGQKLVDQKIIILKKPRWQSKQLQLAVGLRYICSSIPLRNWWSVCLLAVGKQVGRRCSLLPTCSTWSTNCGSAQHPASSRLCEYLVRQRRTLSYHPLQNL